MTRIESHEFDPYARAYPFADGEHEPYVLVDAKSVTFQGQTGPIWQVGVNGCQVDALVRFVRSTLQAFNSKLLCRETALAITKLQEAEFWLEARTRDRKARSVEGTEKP